ncbi:hypothetical protein ACFSTH_12050 [Paenibacillus yanchengensis]
MKEICNGPAQTVYQSLTVHNPDAILSVTNVSDCVMHVYVVGSFGIEEFKILDGDSAIAVVTGLNKISVIHSLKKNRVDECHMVLFCVIIDLLYSGSLVECV